MEQVVIRQETPADYREVEELAREAFWNLYVPGCDEHYLAHILRGHGDFIPQLDLVLEREGQIIASVMYTKTRLVDENGAEKPILTFGPLCVLPEFQRQGYGKQLLEYSFQKAAGLGYDVIVIYGSPVNYVSRGFVSCKKHRVRTAEGTFPTAMLVKELRPGALLGHEWTCCDSPAFQYEGEAAAEFDKLFPKKEKAWQPSQEEFYITSQSRLL